MKSTRPNGLLLAATQQEVRTLPPRRLVEWKQAREDSGRRPGIRLITVNYGAGRVDECSSDEVSRDEVSRNPTRDILTVLWLYITTQYNAWFRELA